MPFNLIEARKQGFSDSEITDLLQEDYPELNVKNAVSNGFTIDEINEELQTPTKPISSPGQSVARQPSYEASQEAQASSVEPVTMTVGPEQPPQDVIGHQSFRKPYGATRDIPEPETFLEKAEKPLKAFAIQGADLLASGFKAYARKPKSMRTRYNPLTGDPELPTKEEVEVFKPKTVKEMTDEEVDQYLAKPAGEKISDWIVNKIDPEWRKDVANVKSLTQSIKDLDLPGGVESAATAIGQQTAIIGTIAAESAIPFAGPVVAATHMIALEAKGFLDNADQIAEQIEDKRLKAEWKMASDKAASRYSVTAGLVEYAGALVGVGKYMPGGAGKAVNKAIGSKTLGIVSRIVGEPIEEMIQSADQNMMMQQAIDEVKKDYPDFNPEWQKESLLESALQALVVSGAHQAGGKIISKIAEKSKKVPATTEPQTGPTLAFDNEAQAKALAAGGKDITAQAQPAPKPVSGPLMGLSEVKKAEEALDNYEPSAEDIAQQELEGVEGEKEDERPSRREMTFEEYEAIKDPVERRRYYEANPVTNRPGQRTFNRLFKERTESFTKPVAVAVGDVNGFKVYNDDLLGEKATDEQNAKMFDAMETVLGPETVTNLHGDEYAIVGKPGETGAQLQARIQKAMDVVAQTTFDAQGATHKPTMTWGVMETNDPEIVGNAKLKAHGKNTIALAGSDNKTYTKIKGASLVSDDEIITREKVYNEKRVSPLVPARPEEGQGLPEERVGQKATPAPAQKPDAEVKPPAAPVPAAPVPAATVPAASGKPKVGQSVDRESGDLEVTEIKRDDSGDYRITGKRLSDGVRVQISTDESNRLMGYTRPKKAPKQRSVWDLAMEKGLLPGALGEWMGDLKSETKRKVYGQMFRGTKNKAPGTTLTKLWESIPEATRQRLGLGSAEDPNVDALGDLLSRPEDAKTALLEAVAEDQVESEESDRQKAALEDRAQDNVTIPLDALKVGDKLKLRDRKTGEVDSYEVIKKDSKKVTLKDGITITRDVNGNIGRVAPDPETGGVVKRDGEDLMEDELDDDADKVPFSRKEDKDASKLSDEGRRRDSDILPAEHRHRKQSAAQGLAEYLAEGAGVEYNPEDIVRVDVKNKDFLRFVEAVRKVFHFVDDVQVVRIAKRLQEIYHIDGVTFRKALFLSDDTFRSISQVVFHESFHRFHNRNPGLYRKYREFTFKNLTQEGRNAIARRLRAERKGVTGELRKKVDVRYATTEILADHFGDQASSEGFWKKLYEDLPEVARALINNIIASLNRLIGYGNVRKMTSDTWFKDAQAQRDQLRNFVRNVMGREGVEVGADTFARFMHQAFHGSPHRFDRFSTDKIGTGEGAQSFGWGIYFTEAKDIAKHYAEALGFVELKNIGVRGLPVYKNNKPIDYSSQGGGINEHRAAIQEMLLINESVFKESKSPSEVLKSVQALFDEEIESARFEKTNDPKYYDVRLRILERYRPKSVSDLLLDVESQKNFYTVTLHKGKDPSQYDYLRWDLPFENQSESVQEKIIAATKELFGGDELNPEKVLEGKDGQSIYANISTITGGMGKTNNPEKAGSLFLLKHGIDGIKYPAGTLSGMKSDAFNYVIFDENAATIEDVAQFARRPAPGQGQRDMFDNDLMDQLEEQEASQPKPKYSSQTADLFGRKAGEQAIAEERTRREQEEKRMAEIDKGLEGTAVQDQEADAEADAAQMALFSRKPSTSFDSPPVNKEDYLSAKDLREKYHSNYFNQSGDKIASSREVPARQENLPIGKWRIDDTAGIHGHEIAQLQMVDTENLIDVEEPEKYRRDDVDRYEQWAKQGLLPPPIEVVKQTGTTGGLKIVDGHRRAAAAKRLGIKVPAWVYQIGDHPEGLKDSAGKVMKVGMTFEMVQEGQEPLFARVPGTTPAFSNDIKTQKQQARSVEVWYHGDSKKDFKPHKGMWLAPSREAADYFGGENITAWRVDMAKMKDEDIHANAVGPSNADATEPSITIKDVDIVQEETDIRFARVPVPNKRVLYHGSADKELKKIVEESGVGGFQYGGLFASDRRGAAESHGKHLYKTKIDENKVLTRDALTKIGWNEDEISYEKITDILKKELPFVETEEDLALAYELIVDGKEITEENEKDAQRVLNEPDQVDVQLKTQQVLGVVARKLGYEAVEIVDEHGLSVLVLPGSKISPVRFDKHGVEIEEQPPLFARRAAAPQWYSKLTRTIEAFQQPKAPAAQWKAMLTPQKSGVKAEELADTGLLDWLDQQEGPITKEDLLLEAQSREIKVSEVELGGVAKGRPKLADFESRDAYNEAVRRADEQGVKDTPETKHSQWQLPGGENYKELLLTLPGATISQAKAAEKHYETFVRKGGMPSWEQLNEQDKDAVAQKMPNYATVDSSKEFRVSGAHATGDPAADINQLSRIRFNERTTPDGEKVLFIEEMQSDWSQQLRSGKDVPDMPFKKSWVDLSLRRMIRYAAENGFDRIAWTTGDQQAERYSLAKQVDRISYVKTSTGYKIQMMKKSGGEWITMPQRYSENELEGVVGKDLAKKIVAGEGEKMERRPERVFSGLDLKVGGEKLKNLYDVMLPAKAKKIIGKMGSRVDKVSIGDNMYEVVPATNQPGDQYFVTKKHDENDPGILFDTEKEAEEYVKNKGGITLTQPSFPITDQMREAVMYEGQPMFARRLDESSEKADRTEAKEPAPPASQKPKLNKAQSYSAVAKMFRASGKMNRAAIKASVDAGEHISTDPKEPGQDSGYLTIWEKAYFKYKDIAYPIIKLQKDLVKAGVKITDAENLKFAVDRVRGAPGIAKQYLADYLKPIYDSFKGKGELAAELSKYLIAKRSQWLYENKAGYTDGAYSKDQADAMVVAVENGNHPHSELIQEKAKLIWGYNKGLLDIKQDHNIIDEDFRNLLTEPYYVPFYRDIDEKSSSKVPGGTKFTATSKGIRRIKGSESGHPIIDPLQSIMAQTYETIINAYRADVANRVIDMAAKSDVFGEMITKLPTRWVKAGTVEHRVEVDAKLAPAIESLTEALGTSVTYKGKLGKGKGGGYRSGEYRPKTDEMRLLYAATEKTKSHELGHVIDEKYPTLLRGLIAKHSGEFGAVADSRYEGEEVPGKYVSYVRKTEEKAAEFVSLYLTDRPRLKEIAPKAFAEFEEKTANMKLLSGLKDMTPSRVAGIKSFDEQTWMMDNSIPRDEDVFSVLREGKLEHYRAPKELAIAIKNLHPEQLPQIFKIITLPTTLLRAGAVGFNLDFFIPNIFRDQMDAATRGRTIPFVDFFAGLKSYLSKDSAYRRFMSSGGAMESAEAGTRGLTIGAENIVYGTKYGKFIDPYWWNKRGIIKGTGDLSLYLMKYPFERIRDLGEISEMASRLGTFTRAEKRGSSVAAAASKARSGTLDFQRFGYNGRLPNQIFPFVNAAMEGLDQFRISAKENPKQILIGSLAYVFAPMIGFLLWNLDRDDDEYKNISAREKMNNWIIMQGRTGKNYWKIPKGHIVKLIGNPFQQVLENSIGTMTAKPADVAINILETLSPIDRSAILPPALKAIFEPWTNYDLYWGKEIEKPAMQALSRGYRWDKNTSESLKIVGRTLGISPAMMQHEVRTIFAGTGVNVLAAIDWMLGKVGAIKPVEITEDRVPILRRFRSKSEEWKSDIAFEERDINKRISEINKMNVSSLVQYYGYSKEDVQKVMRLTLEEEKMLYDRLKKLNNAKKEIKKLSGE